MAATTEQRLKDLRHNHRVVVARLHEVTAALEVAERQVRDLSTALKAQRARVAMLETLLKSAGLSVPAQ